MRTWCSGCLSIVTKPLVRLKSLVTPKGLDSSKDYQNGLWISRKKAIMEAKKKMSDLGGRWGVVQIGQAFIEVEQTYWRLHNIKPVWVRRDWKWLIGR